MATLIQENRRKGKEFDIRAPGKFRLSKLFNLSWSRIIPLFISDILALAIAWQLARYLNQFYSPMPDQLVWWVWFGIPSPFWIFSAIIILLFAQAGLYSCSTQWKNYLKVGQLTSAVYLGSLLVSYFYDPQLNPPRSLFFTAWFSSGFLLIGFRLVTTLLLQQFNSRQSQIPIFLIANSDQMQRLSEVIPKRSPYQIIGVASTSNLNHSETFQAIVKAQPQEVLVTNLPDTEFASALYWQLRRLGIPLRLIPSSREMLHRRGVPEILAGIPTLRVEPPTMGGWEYRIKRSIDWFGALFGVIILFPLLVPIAIAITISSPGNPFFHQQRVGLHGKVFHMLKFRTMIPNAEALQATLEDQNQTDGILFKVQEDPRIIPIGKFLRRTSLDELPQLLNVLAGDMSLVGPRPLPLRDVEQFEHWHHTRHNVIPGITGLWQISGRSELEDFNDIARLDLYYIDNWSLNLDLEILVETVRIVLFSKGAY